ncbi:MAG: cytochrome C oxidase Cbb3, partial [Eggerthellaceae bacterium]|nr:cytochrome C oxidase Cbb3 [Eggerthellaceae bacterium]
LIVSGVLVAIFDAELAGILQRYFADFSFMFLAAAVLLAFIVNERVHTESATGQALRLILLVVVGVSVLYSTLLCFVPEIGWYSDVYGWAYQNVIESFEFWT